MATTTPNRALPVPALADIPDENAAMQAAMTALDNVASFYTGTLANRGPATVTPGTGKGCPGTMYYATDTAQLFVSVGGAWIDLSGATAAPIPVGGSVEYTGASDPSDTRWMLEDGRALSRTQYATLFAVQGTTYGAGDGSTTFNLPDSRGRVTVGPDNMGTAAGAAGRLPNNPNGRGNVGGEERHAQTTAELPSHTHGDGTLTVASHTHGPGTLTVASHAHSGTTGTENQSLSHAHAASAGGRFIEDSIGGGYLVNAGDNFTFGAQTQTAAGGPPAHNHNFSTNAVAPAVNAGATAATAPDVTGATAATGSGTPFNVMQPYIVKNKIIRVL